MRLVRVIARSALGARGFTMVELLFVILVLAILLLIALPSFLGNEDDAHDAEAKAALNTGYKVASTEATRGGVFSPPAQLRSLITSSEPELTVAPGEDPDTDELSVAAASDRDLTLHYLSESGNLCTLTVTQGFLDPIVCGPVAVQTSYHYEDCPALLYSTSEGLTDTIPPPGVADECNLFLAALQLEDTVNACLALTNDISQCNESGEITLPTGYQWYCPTYCVDDSFQIIGDPWNDYYTIRGRPYGYDHYDLTVWPDTGTTVTYCQRQGRNACRWDHTWLTWPKR